MTEAPDREAIIDAVAKARPWRTPSYLVLYFLRRWAVLLFTVSFMLATRQHWAVAAIAIAGALWFDLKVTPNALDLRLDDREFVRKIYDLECFETDLTDKRKKLFKAVNVFIVVLVLLTIVGRIAISYDSEIIINVFATEIITWTASASYIIFYAKNVPIRDVPNPNLYKKNDITLLNWKNLGYYESSTPIQVPLTIFLFFTFFSIIVGAIGISLVNHSDQITINRLIVFLYSTIIEAAGFFVPVVMNIHAKGQRIARYLLEGPQGGNAS